METVWTLLTLSPATLASEAILVLRTKKGASALSL